MLEKFISRHDSTAYRIIDGVALIAGGSDNMLRTLNKTGTFIWEQADGTRSFTDIVELMCREFDVDYNRAAEDTKAFVQEMESKGMLILTGSPAGVMV